MGIETKIKSLGVPQTKILEFSFSTGGHFEKWPKRAVSPSFCLGNIANIIPGSSLKKMIPLLEDHGGVHGDPRWLTCLSIPCWSAKCPYGNLAPSCCGSVWWSWLHPIVQGGFVVVGPADWMLRIAFPSWFHNCSIGFISGLHAVHYIPGIYLACKWSRTILAIWGRTLNQDKCLWTRQWNCETWAMRSCFGLSAFMSCILCMEITNKWLIAPLYRANTDESCIWHFSL